MSRRKPADLRLSDVIRLTVGDHCELSELQHAEATIDRVGEIAVMMADEHGNSDVEELIEERAKEKSPDAATDVIAGFGPVRARAEEALALEEKQAAYYLGLAVAWRLARRLSLGGSR
jgi:hypothetical protein